MSQERGKERALQAYPPDGGECGRESCDWNHDKREGYERGYNDAMAESREWSDNAVEAAAITLFLKLWEGESGLCWDDVGDSIKDPYRKSARAALIAAEKAERERVQHG